MPRKRDDLSGREIGLYKVLRYDKRVYYEGGQWVSYYICECKRCGNRFSLSRNSLLRSKGKWHWGPCVGK